jgi:hypothetical protein
MRAEEFQESAADELKRKLPSLTRTDYTTIDKLMRRIGRRHHISGRKLHDLFVSKYGESPDHWIKKYKNTIGEGDVVKLPIKKSLNRKRQTNVIELPPKKQRTVKKPEDNITPINIKDKKIDEGVDSKLDLEQVKHFISWTVKQLNLEKKLPKIILSNNTKAAQKGHHTGLHTNNNGTEIIWVYVKNRNLIDIFRTIFHELVHQKQGELDMLKPGVSYPGSPVEAMADMLAGKYIKIYGKQHPEIFQ